jgi:branched-chain amino acid transport system substrate-binding protein
MLKNAGTEMMGTKTSPSRLLIALGASLLFATSAARAEDGVLRVGIITDMSGQYADGNGTGSVVAAQMAAEEIGGTVAGRNNKGVDVIAEGVNSAVALAIQTVTRERKKLFLISGSGSSDLTGKQCSPTSVQWTYDTYASSNATAKAVVARGGSPWFFLTADYAFGQALERDASKAVTAAGGKVLGAVRHPFDTADFSSFLLQAQSSGAKILALANAGSDFRNAVAQADEFNLRESMQLVALQVTLTDVPALGLQHAHDLLFTDSFYWDRTPETRAFAQEFFKRHGAMPTAYQAGVNSALRHYFKAVAATNSVDSETVIAQMRKTPVNDFFAQGGVVREDGRMVHDMYLMRIKKPEESKSKWDLYEYLATVPGDQAFRPLSEGGCPYLAKSQ